VVTEDLKVLEPMLEMINRSWGLSYISWGTTRFVTSKDSDLGELYSRHNISHFNIVMERLWKSEVFEDIPLEELDPQCENYDGKVMVPSGYA